MDDGESKIADRVASLSSDSVGTHFVKSVTYGAEMVASLKFKSLSASKS